VGIKGILQLKGNRSIFSAQSQSNKTRGPKGPWVAHLRKRSKLTVKALPLVVQARRFLKVAL